MKILFDTHTFLWFIQGDGRMSGNALQAIQDTGNELFFSAASYWEMCIKISIGKLRLEGAWQRIIEQTLLENSIMWMEIKKAHMEGILKLPMHHRDPFDRLLISQALHEKCSFCSGDKAMEAYDLPLI
jgi:PIN domain nuclease of toxin-antitoxin system